MLNGFWLWMFALAMACGAANDKLDEVARASIDSAVQASNLALGLIGPMALWLGLVRVLHDANLMAALARPLRRMFVWLFPEVPADHPALGMITLNMTANVLGLGNAATPFGLKAMRALQTLNANKHIASNAMVLFLVINTSGLAVLPTGMIALRATLGSTAPGAIFLPTIVSTLTAAIVGILAAKCLAVLPYFRAPASLAAAEPNAAQQEPQAFAETPDTDAQTSAVSATLGSGTTGKTIVQAALFGAIVFGALAWGTWRQATATDNPIGLVAAIRQGVGAWSLLVLMGLFVLFGVARGVRVYDAIVLGGREAFNVALGIIPYLVAILVATGMLRASGAIDSLTSTLAPMTAWIGMPAQALPMALLRPLTGTGAYAIAADIMRAQGPDSLTGQIVSTLMGTTETTFYVLALYLGAVGIRDARHALWACVIADIGGTMMAVWSCRWLLH